MPSIPLYPPSQASTSTPNPLPSLLHTPSGLAILELQGTLHTTHPSDPSPIGKLIFPLHDASRPDDTAWMKRAHLYVGQHQRLTGEVKKLPKPLGVIRRRQDGEEALEIVEVVHYKLVFGSRPEPVGGEQET